MSRYILLLDITVNNYNLEPTNSLKGCVHSARKFSSSCCLCATSAASTCLPHPHLSAWSAGAGHPPSKARVTAGSEQSAIVHGWVPDPSRVKLVTSAGRGRSGRRPSEPAHGTGTWHNRAAASPRYRYRRAVWPTEVAAPHG